MTSKRFDNDPGSPARKRARDLARADEKLHAKLLRAREIQGLTQQGIADIMGVSQPTVASFEAYDNDPKLSTIRRYAHAVGVTISHSVTLDGLELDCGWTSFGEAEFEYVTAVTTLPNRPTAQPSLTIYDLDLAA